MKNIKLGLLGLALTATALLSIPSRAESQQQACTLLCIQVYHCCVDHNGTQSCIPESEPCKG